uniref:Uncharacterized protein n=1 Tax=Streptomyces sp. F12 TaxID=1436084 RepID=V9Z9R7_9ACTN|nr:hypothetical protein pFRL6_89c [Streptomyces sp. F12]
MQQGAQHAARVRQRPLLQRACVAQRRAAHCCGVAQHLGCAVAWLPGRPRRGCVRNHRALHRPHRRSSFGTALLVPAPRPSPPDADARAGGRSAGGQRPRAGPARGSDAGDRRGALQGADVGDLGCVDEVPRGSNGGAGAGGVRWCCSRGCCAATGWRVSLQRPG